MNVKKQSGFSICWRFLLIAPLELMLFKGSTSSMDIYHYEERLGFVLETFTDEIKASGYLRCVEYCVKDYWCRGVSFNKESGFCRLSSSFDHNQLIRVKVNPYWTLYLDIEEREELVYKICAGNNETMGHLWPGNTTHPVTTSEQHTLTGECEEHYKSPLVEKWQDLQIEKVRIAFIKGDKHKSLTFNASGTDKTNWFSAERILDSDWSDSDLMRTMPYKQERFKYWYAKKSDNTTCKREDGWFVILEQEPGIGTACDWERSSSQAATFPMILYSNRRATYMDRFVKECLTTHSGVDYAGFKSVTVSNRTCQRWDVDEPHTASYDNLDSYPDKSWEEVANYCRNPDFSSETVWCYTISSLRWDHCEVPKCLDGKGVIYRRSDLVAADCFAIFIQKNKLVEVVPG